MTTEKFFEAKCPNCGSIDVDLSHSLDPIKDGVKCYDCKEIYQLGPDTGNEITEEELEEKLSSGWATDFNIFKKLQGKIRGQG